MINVTAKVYEPKEVNVSVTITMPIGQWNKFRQEVAAINGSTEQPLWTLRDSIEKALWKVCATATETIEP